MGIGQNSRFQYSPGVPTALAVNPDPLISLGGGSPHGVVSSLPDARGSEAYADSEWSLDLTNPTSGRIKAAFAGGLKFAEVGDWLMCVEQNTGDEPSYDVADDSRGSIARILTLAGPAAETSNETTFADVTLDRPLSGLAVANDAVHISKPNNVFAQVTEAQARAGIIDHSGLWYWNTDANLEEILFWIEPVQPNGCILEIMRPGEFRGFISMANVLASSTDTPFTPHGRALEIPSLFDVSGPPTEVPSRSLSLQNGALPTPSTTTFFRSPFWMRRTVPADTNPGLAVFVVHSVSDQLIDGTVLNDFDRLNGGFVITFGIDAPATRSMISVPDRISFAGGGARIVTTLQNGAGLPLPNRSIVISADIGTVSQDPSILTDENGRLTSVYAAPPGSGGQTETITATLSRSAVE